MRECKKLFKDMKFFLNREVYRDSLLFIIPAFGGIVSWQGDGAPFEEDDDSITHQIIDRPRQDGKICGREYVHPQWVYDCVNARIILPTGDYLVERDPPPHLSPFVDNDSFETEGVINRAEAAKEKRKKMKAHEKQHHHELIMELEGVTDSSSISNIDNLSAEREEPDHDYEQVEEDNRIMSEIELSRWLRGVIEGMRISRQRKKHLDDVIRQRRRNLRT
ncbi:pescadillo homolog [Prunus yedoensis var. nudiflora]|uniref:Pescadillo homolog n=1 Tax=Prunus yedoensis var. nudiflora TaxID=2094558 RepID=A0A314YC01_PRUYE|nr:pescadillo homolog [Prunus yedoensis var. nudiflora]PQQ03035.1 pescadillo homolog [Prunus yedoensis var. nudiflora]